MIRPSILLQRALLADALFSGVAAVLLSAASTPLATVLNLPAALLFESGLFLIGYTLLVGWMSRRDALPLGLVWAVIAGNALWTIASIALISVGPVTPNLLGIGFVVAQAIAVGTFAELQFIGLRKSTNRALA